MLMLRPRDDGASNQTNSLRKKLENYSYLLDQIIGSGYSSKVYKGRNDLSGESFAIKMIDLKMLTNPIHQALLNSEIACLKRLNCYPNIIRLADVFTTKNNTYIITELCEGGDLAKHLLSHHQSSGSAALQQQSAVALMQQIIAGYLCIWRNGIIHRDLKPANIFLLNKSSSFYSTPILKIADFGFAILQQDAQKSRSYNVGSPLYMPPEALISSKYSFKSDIWALGVIFFEMLTGRHPWKANTQKQLAALIKSRSISSLLPSGLAPTSIDFLLGTLNPDLQQRMGPLELEHFSFERDFATFNQQQIFHRSLYLGKYQFAETPKLHSKAEENMSAAYLRDLQTQSARNLSTYIKSPLRNQRYTDVVYKNNLFTEPENGGSQLIRHLPSRKSLLPEPAHSSQEQITAYHPRHPFTIHNPQHVALFDAKSLTEQSRKHATKMLLCEIHFCRFLYKLVLKLQELEVPGSSRLREQLLALIFQKLEELLSCKTGNPYCLENIEAFRCTPDFGKVMSVVQQYQLKYAPSSEKPLSPYDGGFFLGQIKSVVIRLYDLARDYLPYEISDVQEQIILLDYLLTCSQLVALNSESSLQTFCRKSNMEVIAAGVADAEVTLAHFIAIQDKMRALNFI